MEHNEPNKKKLKKKDNNKKNDVVPVDAEYRRRSIKNDAPLPLAIPQIRSLRLLHLVVFCSSSKAEKFIEEKKKKN